VEYCTSIVFQVQEEEWRNQEERLKEQLKELRTKLKEQALDHQIQLAAREEAWQEERRALRQSADHHVASPTAEQHVPTIEAEQADKSAQLVVINAELTKQMKIRDDELDNIRGKYAHLESKCQEAEAKVQEAEARTQQVKEEYLKSESQYQAKIEHLQSKCSELQVNYEDLEARWRELKAENEVLLKDGQKCQARVQESETRQQALERECQHWEEKLKVAYENRDREAGLREAERAELTRQLEEAGRSLEKYEKEAAASAGGHKGPAATVANSTNVDDLVAENKALKVSAIKIFSSVILNGKAQICC
jgi:chromosome segregation ATPase